MPISFHPTAQFFGVPAIAVGLLTMSLSQAFAANYGTEVIASIPAAEFINKTVITSHGTISMRVEFPQVRYDRAPMRYIGGDTVVNGGVTLHTIKKLAEHRFDGRVVCSISMNFGYELAETTFWLLGHHYEVRYDVNFAEAGIQMNPTVSTNLRTERTSYYHADWSHYFDLDKQTFKGSIGIQVEPFAAIGKVRIHVTNLANSQDVRVIRWTVFSANIPISGVIRHETVRLYDPNSDYTLSMHGKAAFEGVIKCKFQTSVDIPYWGAQATARPKVEIPIWNGYHTFVDHSISDDTTWGRFIRRIKFLLPSAG